MRRPTSPAMQAVVGSRSVVADPAAPDASPPAVRRPISSVLGGLAPGYTSRAEPSPPPIRRPSTSSMPALAAPRPSFDAAPYASSSGLQPFRPTRALGPPDDLKRIRGIGPATEKRLNEVGVSTWAQVAAFAPNEIPTVADITKVSIDKIRPWIDQAKTLVANDQNE